MKKEQIRLEQYRTVGLECRIHVIIHPLSLCLLLPLRRTPYVGGVSWVFNFPDELTDVWMFGCLGCVEVRCATTRCFFSFFFLFCMVLAWVWAWVWAVIVQGVEMWVE